MGSKTDLLQGSLDLLILKVLVLGPALALALMLTFVAMALLLFLVALAASFVPARRAARIDPTSALKAN